MAETGLFPELYRGSGYFYDPVTRTEKVIPAGSASGLSNYAAPTLGELPVEARLTVRGGGGNVANEDYYGGGQLYRGRVQPLFDFSYQQPGQFDPYAYHPGGALAPNLLAQQPQSTNISGSSSTTGSVSLPEDVRGPYVNQINTATGLAASAGKDVEESRDTATTAATNLLASPGYTEEEIQAMLISPEEEARLSTRSMDPAIGAANRAQQNLLAYTAAAGNFNPGLNASMMEIQREQGRQASKARLDARFGVQENNRRAVEVSANARTNQENVGTANATNLLATSQNREANQLGNTTNLLSSFPERSDTRNTTNSNISTSGPSSQVGIAPAPGAAPGAAPAPASRPSWMSDRQFRDYSNANPGTSGGGATPPRQGINSFYGTRSGSSTGRLSYAY